VDNTYWEKGTGPMSLPKLKNFLLVYSLEEGNNKADIELFFREE